MSDETLKAFLICIAAFVVIAATVFIGVFVGVPLLVIGGIIWWIKKLNEVPPLTTPQLYAQIEAAFPKQDDLQKTIGDRMKELWVGNYPPYDVLNFAGFLIEELYEQEHFDIPPLEFHPAGSIEDGRYRDQLKALKTKADYGKATTATFVKPIVESVSALNDHLPTHYKTLYDALKTENTAFSMKLPEALPRFGNVLTDMLLPFFAAEPRNLHLFETFREQLNSNQLQASPKPDKHLVMPDEYEGTPREIIDAFLRFTPLKHLSDVNIPFSFDTDSRLEHWHLLAPTGHGKTQTLQHIIYHDLTAPDPPSLVVVDSQGEMLARIAQLQIFKEHPERLILIDPDLSPALNMFDQSNDRRKRYDPRIREQIEAEILQQFTYVFAALEADLSSKMGTAFSYLVRLVYSIPGSNIHTFCKLLEERENKLENVQFYEHIQKLDPIAQDFFKNQFFEGNFRTSRQALARRIYELLSVPAFVRMFTATTNKLDMFQALQSGCVVLVNTSKAALKDNASKTFGRFMIAQTMNAIFERVTLKPHERRTTYLIVDEAHEYFGDRDDSLLRILEQARKNRLGILFAHHNMDQLSQSLRSAVLTNTTIKTVGGISAKDANLLDADMRATVSFLTDTPKNEDSTTYACYIRNKTKQAVRLEIPFLTLENAPKMSDAEFRQLVELQCLTYSDPSTDVEEPEPFLEPEQFIEPEPPAPPPQPTPPQTRGGFEERARKKNKW